VTIARGTELWPKQHIEAEHSCQSGSLSSGSGISIQRHSFPPRTFDAGEPDSRDCGGSPPAAGYEVTTGVGKTGVVGVLRSGDGPAIMLRADMDAPPVREATGLPYASKMTTDQEGKYVPVMHACGHDMHVTWLIGAATLLAQNRSAWRGTLFAFALNHMSAIGGEGTTTIAFGNTCRMSPRPNFRQNGAFGCCSERSRSLSSSTRIAASS